MTPLTRQLSQLETSGLIRLATIEPELEYLFRHALVQDAAYQSLLISDRRRLHQAVGRVMESLYADQLDEHAATLARHFDQAGDRRRALRYYCRAGDVALSRYANPEAESHFRHAVDLCEPGANGAAHLAKFGEALVRQDRFEEGLAVLRRALELYRSVSDMEAVAHLYARSARAASYSTGFPESLRICLEGLEAVAGASESGELARLLHETARAHHFSGQSIEAEPFCRRAIDIAQGCGAVDVQADALATLGIMPQLTGEEGIAALRRAVELAEAHGLVAIAARAHNNLGVMMLTVHEDARGSLRHFRRATELDMIRGAGAATISPMLSVVGQSLAIGDVAGARNALEWMVDLAESLPDPETVRHVIHFAQGFVAAFEGEFDRALEFYRLARAGSVRRADQMTLLNSSFELASACVAMDRHRLVLEWQEAEDALEAAISIAEAGLDSPVGPLCALSIVCARQRRLDDARLLLAKAMREAGHQPTPVSEVEIRSASMEIAITERRWADALGAVEKNAAFQLKHERAGYWAAEIEVWADIYLRRGAAGDRERAHVLLLQARDVYRELGLPLREARLNERLAAVRTETFARARAGDIAALELAVAGRIQAGLMPETLPTLPGWDLVATLEPARETWGDFYDCIILPSGRLLLIIADVADKGAGAALYMALTRTLLRTAAALHPHDPALVLATANERLLTETNTGMFVTVFCALLDPEVGTVFYANAGHNPAYLLQPNRAHSLAPTGMALGVVPEATWDAGCVSMAPADTLLLYTDGVLDAHSPDGDSFGLERLLTTARARLGSPSAEMQAGLLAEIHSFVGKAPRFDDLTLIVVTRI